LPSSNTADALAHTEPLLQAVKPASAQEYLCVLLHSAMLAAGFVPVHSEQPGGMPAGWRQIAGMISMDYAHSRYAAIALAQAASAPAGSGRPVVQVKGFGMGEPTPAGPSLLVLQAVVLHAGSANLVTCSLE
jgi:hypothetical protein